MRLFLFPTILVLLTSFQPGFSQLRYGIHAGIGINNMSDINDPPEPFESDYYEAAMSYLFGMFGEFQLSEKFDLYTELNYERRGANVAVFDQGEIRFNYLSLPLQLQYSLQNDISFKLGPQFNYLVSGISDFLPDSEVDEVYDDFDIGINFGISYPIIEKIRVAARYYHGLKPLDTLLFTEDANDPGEEFEFGRHRHWAIGVQYYLH